QVAAEIEPTQRSPTLVPIEWAASSTTRVSGRPAAAAISSTGAGAPAKCKTTMASTGPEARTASATDSASGIRVSGLTSTRTGWSPAWTIAWTAPQKVIVDVSTL